MLSMNRYISRRANKECSPRSLAQRAGQAPRRGVVSVVSMMFLILFGSLAAAMAIMSKSNIVTAATHQHVNRAFGAAETGLRVAEARLTEAVRRFVVERGEIDQVFANELWSGSYSGTFGTVNVNPPKSYPDPGSGTVAGVGDALVEIHDQDERITHASYKSLNGIEDPTFAGSATSAVFTQGSLVLGTPSDPQTAFQVTYEPLANGTDIRIRVTGYDFTYNRNGKPVERTISQDFRMVKRIDAAVMAPSRIMIGKNVMVDGDLGAVYTDVDKEHGDPLIMKSDFYGIDATLDDHIEALGAGLATHDTNLDNRLAVNHPVESAGIPEIDGKTGDELDATEDGYVDDFDLFIRRFDANKDGKVVLSNALTLGTPFEGQTAEFVSGSGTSIDDDLGMLLDTGTPDRNRNKVYGFDDANGDGVWQPKAEEAYDWEAVDPDAVPADLKKYVHTSPSDRVYVDQVLGYRDGVIDARDAYAKVSGRLMFRVKESDWLANQGGYMAKLQGAIVPKDEGASINFEVGEDDLPLLTGANFTNSQTALKAIADGDTFDEQVAENLGISPGALATWEKSMNNPMAGAPKFTPLKPDGNKDGLPDNWDTTAYFEKTPFNSPTYADWYYRPVYENMTFKNCAIPTGTNALFVNCTFVGVTYVKTYVANEHPNWTIYGKLKMGRRRQARARSASSPVQRRQHADDAEPERQAGAHGRGAQQPARQGRHPVEPRRLDARLRQAPRPFADRRQARRGHQALLQQPSVPRLPGRRLDRERFARAVHASAQQDAIHGQDELRAQAPKRSLEEPGHGGSEGDRQELDDAAELLGGHRAVQQPAGAERAASRGRGRGRAGYSRQRGHQRRAAAHLQAHARAVSAQGLAGQPGWQPRALQRLAGLLRAR
jgi:hypothetical protein